MLNIVVIKKVLNKLNTWFPEVEFIAYKEKSSSPEINRFWMIGVSKLDVYLSDDMKKKSKLLRTLFKKQMKNDGLFSFSYIGNELFEELKTKKSIRGKKVKTTLK